MANAIDYGETEFILSKDFKGTLLRYRSENFPGCSLLFRNQKSCGVKSYWVCLKCVQINDQNLSVKGRTIVDGVRIVTNPEDGHHPNCEPKPDSEIEALIMTREAKLECRLGRKRPLQAYTEKQADIPKRFRLDDDMQEAVEECFPAYASVRRSLYLQSEKGRIPIPDSRNLPQPYCTTHRGKTVEAASVFYSERWLLFSSPNPQPLMHVFSSDLDLQILHSSHCWIMDGTFKVCPKDFVQLYTIHGYGSFQDEGHPVAHALLSNKNEATYVEILSQIRIGLQLHHGNVGQLQIVLVDFEKAVHNAIRHVYPNVGIKGCNFHFGQALHRRLQQEGAQQALQIPIVEEWVGCVRSLSILPPQLLGLAWDAILQHPPVIPDPQEQQALVRFADYFSQYWLQERDFPVSTWNHWDNDGLRTTNHAEGYHSLINQNDCNEMHLCLRNFLSWLQLAHNRYQVRMRNLLKANEFPKRRNPIYADLHRRIIQAKQTFFQGTSHLWNFIGFNHLHMQIYQQNDYFHLVNEIHQFLLHIRHLIGKQ